MKRIFLSIYKRFIQQYYSFGFKNVKVMPTSFISHDCEIGEYSYIGHYSHITKAKIGRYCSIANNVAIGQGEHLTEKISNSSIFYEDPYNELVKGECIIGNDVWIAHGSIIRRGVSIGDGAIIGANTFVNKDVPPFAIVVGNPGKILKYKFEHHIQNQIIESRWWYLDPLEAKEKMQNLRNDYN